METEQIYNLSPSIAAKYCIHNSSGEENPSLIRWEERKPKNGKLDIMPLSIVRDTDECSPMVSLPKLLGVCRFE
jgi:hypothetical protein